MFQKIEKNNWDIDRSPAVFGGKGANLLRMKNLDLPVPGGFLIGIEWCEAYNRQAYDIELYVLPSIMLNLAELEAETDKKFGAATKANTPLLVSVRSGAPISMPGMMDTVLNVGLNDKSVKALATLTNPEFAWDSYRRFVQSYATIVLGQPRDEFDKLLKAAEHFCGGKPSLKMNQHLVSKFKLLAGAFPQDVGEQLYQSILAVFKSWNSERAIAYRQHEHINGLTGTGVVVQEMVFGNMNDNSCTGVLFTRNPVTGTGELYGDFLPNAQGEDVVDGSRNPLPFAEMQKFSMGIYEDLAYMSEVLERDLQDMCDIEFTVEDGKLYVLQVRSGKRSSKAALRIPLELVRDRRIDVDRAMELISKAGAVSVDVAETNSEGYTLIGNGLVASEGDIEGVIALSCDAAINYHNEGKKVILVSERTDPDDMPGIIAADGILTFTGGLVSHAAVVARAWDKPCIVGMGTRLIDAFNNQFDIWGGFNAELSLGRGTQKFKNGDLIILRPSENGAVYMKKAEDVSS